VRSADSYVDRQQRAGSGTALAEGVYDVRAVVAIALLMPMRPPHLSDVVSSGCRIVKISIRYVTPLRQERIAVAAKAYKVTSN